jgi:hypothetical protein
VKPVLVAPRVMATALDNDTANLDFAFGGNLERVTK